MHGSKSSISLIIIGEKMENQKIKFKKSLICTLLISVAFSAMATQTACARETAPPLTPPDSTPITVGDNPILTAQDSAATGSDTSLLDRAQDNSTTLPDDNATLYTTQDTLNEENPPLIAPRAQPDNIATILGIAALAAAAATVAVVVVVRLRKKI
jgi:hypothetical protein